MKIMNGCNCNVAKNGDKGSKVEEIQTLLKKAGFDCGEVDGNFGIKTQAAVTEAQTFFYVNGIFNDALHFLLFKKTQSAHEIPNIDDTRFNKDLFVKLCIEEGSKGYHEGKVGSYVWKNFIKEWDENAGYGTKMYAWCAMFVHEMLDRSGCNLSYFYKGRSFALVRTFRLWGQDLGFYKRTPQEGDLAIWNNDQHIGVVLEVHKDNILTAEGNSSDRLKIRIVKKTAFKGFVRIPDNFQA